MANKAHQELGQASAEIDKPHGKLIVNSNMLKTRGNSIWRISWQVPVRFQYGLVVP
jgi:hypothetical protein